MKLRTWLRAPLREIRARVRLRRQILSHTQDVGLPYPQIKFSRIATPFGYDCHFNRSSGRYVVTLLGDRTTFISRLDRVAAPLYWFSRCPPSISSMLMNLSDGDAPSRAPFSYSVNSPDVVPLPDKDFFNTRGFENIRSFVRTHDVEWSQRSNRVRWRGCTNGAGGHDYSKAGACWDQSLLPRIRMVLILRGADATDVAFVGSYTRGLAAKLSHDGLMATKIPEKDWINDKLALDIDGTTNTWSNMLVRMHLGCCIIKVDSQEGFRQWYYDRIRPWEHFVPVKSDMSDLIEKIEWARSHDAEAQAIAANGRAFARSMTFESETDHAIAAICATQGVSLTA
jgi:hypothetical protein